MKYNKAMTITEYILNNPNTPVKVTAVATALGVSKGNVSLTLKNLVKDGFVKDLRVDMDNPRTRALKIMINIESIARKGAVGKLRRYAVGIGLYGSWAKGTNTEESDVDIWIKPNGLFKQSNLAKITGEIRELLGADAQILVLSKERLEHLKKDNVVFYHSLLFSSIRLYGEGIE